MTQLRNLPSVDRVMAAPGVAAAAAAHSREWVVALVRGELAAARRRVREGGVADGADEIAALVGRRIEEAALAEPRRVINATGVVIHTNLGRAPLSRAAMQAAEEAAAGYSNLEYDLASGRRGGRYARLESLLRQLTGAEAALAVNNNAAAVLLGLSGPGRRPRGDRFPRRSGGNRRRFPRPRRAAPERGYIGGCWHDQPHLLARL